jgi:hypothetical protein
VAEAPQHAAAAWAGATAADRTAEEALKRRDFARAQAAWREAEERYRAAEREASDKLAAASAAEAERVAALKRDLEATERVAAAAGAARREAEQAGAPRHAARAFAAAGEKQREGQTALERQGYAAAQRRFREAQEEYQRAAQEAQKAAAAEAATAAALGQDLERGRAAVATARQQALAVGADRLAREAFEGARAREGEAAALESQQNLAGAARAFQDASQRYAEALRRAQVARGAKAEADHARARMLAQKEGARPEAAEYRSAVTEEVQGEQAYERLAFKEAAGHYQAAHRLFSRATGGGGRPGSGDARAEIRGVLESYRQAVEGKDVALFQTVRPTMKETDVRRSFEQSESHKLVLTIASIDVNGDQAEVRGRRADEVVSRDGRRLANEQAVVFKLKRTPAGWVIDAIN